MVREPSPAHSRTLGTCPSRASPQGSGGARRHPLHRVCRAVPQPPRLGLRSEPRRNRGRTWLYA
eukprot:scaffold39307_cov69-Phaeocystis_antarctica.AAC.8